MTKQPPYVTKLRLSKLCRGIIALAVVKLCLLVAIVADIPLPELRWEKSNVAQQNVVKPETSQNSSAAPAASMAGAAPAEGNNSRTSLVMGNPSRSLLADSSSRPGTAESAPTPPVYTTGNTAPTKAPSPAATPTQAEEPVQAEPQGAAAAAAAARMRPLTVPSSQAQPAGASVTMAVSPLTREKAEDIPSAQKPAETPRMTAESPAAPVPASPATPVASAAPAAAIAPIAALPPLPADNAPSSGPALLLASDTTNAPSPAPSAAAGDNPWWKNMLQITHLPVPSMGVAQVAHAAALDTPPAPAVQGNTGGSPFTPPAQQVIPKGQDASGAPLPPRSTTARPAGSPQLPSPAGTNADPMTSTVAPPAPNVGAYTPPEDPNRKQQELARREQEILALKQQMEQRLEELRTAEMRVKGMIKDAQGLESQKVSGLIAVYANMKPKQAAQTLQNLDERVAVKILTGLTPKQAGEILSYADPKTTAKLTELMTRMHMQP